MYVSGECPNLILYSIQSHHASLSAHHYSYSYSYSAFLPCGERSSVGFRNVKGFFFLHHVIFNNIAFRLAQTKISSSSPLLLPVPPPYSSASSYSRLRPVKGRHYDIHPLHRRVVTSHMLLSPICRRSISTRKAFLPLSYSCSALVLIITSIVGND